MSDYNDLFLRSPESFMAKHVVVIVTDRITGMDDVGGLTYWKVAEVPGAQVVNTGGKVFNAIPTKTPGPGMLPAYWCPYNQNGYGRVTLGNDALYMFTVTMNGCTLGAGNYAGDGVRSVIHMNCSNSGEAVAGAGMRDAQAQQTKMQHNLLRGLLGSKVATVAPSDYRMDTGNELTGNCTTFGTHPLGRDWDFYAHTYLKLGTVTWYNAGVKKVLAGSVPAVRKGPGLGWLMNKLKK